MHESYTSGKDDTGKLQLSLVPMQIVKDIAEVRMFGNKKYHSPDNWKQVDVSPLILPVKSSSISTEDTGIISFPNSSNVLVTFSKPSIV